MNEENAEIYDNDMEYILNIYLAYILYACGVELNVGSEVSIFNEKIEINNSPHFPIVDSLLRLRPYSSS
jgi:hypothetical protein